MKEGDLYPVWWSTGVREGAWNLARIIGVQPYTGRYPESFTHVLKLHAPNTDRGWLEMAVHEDKPYG
jgi:hypothetical protein